MLDTGRVSLREALAIVPRICDALQFAHDHGIVHRDINPENRKEKAFKEHTNGEPAGESYDLLCIDIDASGDRRCGKDTRKDAPAMSGLSLVPDGGSVRLWRAIFGVAPNIFVLSLFRTVTEKERLQPGRLQQHARRAAAMKTGQMLFKWIPWLEARSAPPPDSGKAPCRIPMPE